MSELKAETPVIDFDHRDDISKNNPYERWRHMRAECPVAYSESYDGFYVISRYADSVAGARDTDDFSSALKQTQIPTLPSPPHPPVHTDPPQHRAYRQIINPFFALPKMVEYEPWVQEIVNSVVDPVMASDAFDVPHELAMPVTRQVITRIMGIKDVPTEVNNWMDDFTLLLGEPSRAASEKLQEFLTAERDDRIKSPGTDVISAMVLAEIDGHRIIGDVVGMSMLVLAGGLETTNSAIAAAIWYLLDHPEDRERLQNEPDLWLSAMEEFVRWSSPVPNISRTARNDVEVLGCPIPAGSRVMFQYGSANRDPSEFDDPDAVILDRYPNRHLGFGIGPHRCAGSHLAKLMMRLVLRRVLPHLDQWRVADPAMIGYKAAGTRGMNKLPLVRIPT